MDPETSNDRNAGRKFLPYAALREGKKPSDWAEFCKACLDVGLDCPPDKVASVLELRTQWLMPDKIRDVLVVRFDKLGEAANKFRSATCAPSNHPVIQRVYNLRGRLSQAIRRVELNPNQFQPKVTREQHSKLVWMKREEVDKLPPGVGKPWVDLPPLT